MRVLMAAILLLTLGAHPLSAQLTADERRAREAADLSREYARRRTDRLEERALAGDATAYAGPAGWEGRPEWTPYGRWNYLNTSRWRAPMGAPIHWAALSAAPERANSLKPLTTARLNAKAGAPAILTLASPIGGPERTLMIRTAVAGADGEENWSRMGELTADAEGRFLIPLPTLDPGMYSLEIEVFDRDHPGIPYSASKNSLRIE